MSRCFWLMMASTAIDVLPVARSPMMSSRWPRPSANIASTTENAGLHRRVDEIALDDRRRRPLDRHGGFGRRPAGRGRAAARADRRRGRGAFRRPARRRPRRSPLHAVPPRFPASSRITAAIASFSSDSAKPIPPPSKRSSSPSRDLEGRRRGRRRRRCSRRGRADRASAEVDPAERLASRSRASVRRQPAPS